MATESDENVEYHIYIESECLVTVNSVADILADRICAYFGSNIAYPNSLYPILILLQHFVLGKIAREFPSYHVISLFFIKRNLLMYSTMLTFHIFLAPTKANL